MTAVFAGEAEKTRRNPMIQIEDKRLVYHYDAEEVWIEPWGPDAVRVRATKECRMPE